MGKLTISMAIFNSYVKLPEGKSWSWKWLGWWILGDHDLETTIWMEIFITHEPSKIIIVCFCPWFFFSTRNGIYTPFTGRLVGKRMNWSLVYIWNRTSLVWWFLAEFRCHKLKRWQQLSHFCDFPRDLLDFGRLLYNICTVFQVYPSALVVCSMIPSVSKMSVRGIFQTSPNPRTVSQ